jgi:hypothetical protein
MATKYKTNKRKLSSLVKQQVPEFVLTDHPKFAEFLSSYYLFMESAELNLDTITATDNILLETEGTVDSYVLLNQTDKNGLDAGNQLVHEENTFLGSFAKNEVITGSTSGATSTVLAEDTTNNSRLFVSANNAWITGETVTGGTSGATAKVAKYRANPVENLQQLLNYSDPDHTISDFLTQMKEEFLNTIPKNTNSAVDTRKLIKNIKSLYRTKGTAKAHKAFFRLLFNETSEVYLPVNDMLRVSGGKWSGQNFIRCTQTTSQALNDSTLLVGQTITQANNPADDDVNLATAIVENITKYQQGSIEIIEVEVNSETMTGTFVTGETVTGVSNLDSDVIVKITISQGISATTITNDGSTLTVGDEATLTGGAGAGARIQVQDISGAGVDDVIVNAAGTDYEEGDTITFSSGTAEAKVSVVGGGFAPETGSVDIHVELESGTITGSGSGDLSFETAVDSGKGGKFLDSASQMVDNEIKTKLEITSRVALENEDGSLVQETGSTSSWQSWGTDYLVNEDNEVGNILSEESGDGQTSNVVYIVNEEHQADIPYNMELTDHIVQENETQNDGLYSGRKLVQENSTGSGDITDIRMIASGSGYTTLPTATITVGDRFLGLETQTNRQRLGNIILEGTSGDLTGFLEFQQNDGHIIDEQESTVALEADGTGAGRIEFEDGGRMLSETFTGATATVIPFGDDIGRATSFNIVEHGINYTSAPTLAFPHYAVLKTVSSTITADETFTTDISGATGTVVDYTYPLLKYTATTSALEITDTVTFSGGTTAIVAKSDPLTGTNAIATNITTTGKYVNQDGHLSELSKKIQDSLYYQDYSYVVKVSESIDKWRDALKRAVHPSGFYVTGQVNIATQLSGQVKQPVGATLSSGLFSGTSDSPIYMRLNTLFNTIFGRRTGVGLKFMSNAIELDGKTKRSRAASIAGYSPTVSTAFTSSHYTAGQKDVNLSPETTIEMEQRNRNSFYDLKPVLIQTNFALESATGGDGLELENETGNLVVTIRNEGYTVRDVEVRNGYAFGGPRVKNLSTYAFSAFAANNAITLEGGTGEGEILLENESGVLQHPQSDSWSTTVADWNTLRFTGTLNSSVDGETMRLSDINGMDSSQNHKINWAFPTEVTKSA